jgi:hypothetical protein
MKPFSSHFLSRTFQRGVNKLRGLGGRKTFPTSFMTSAFLNTMNAGQVYRDNAHGNLKLAKELKASKSVINALGGSVFNVAAGQDGSIITMFLSKKMPGGPRHEPLENSPLGLFLRRPRILPGSKK